MNRAVACVALTLACALAGCDKPAGAGAPTEAKELAAKLTGDDKGEAALNPQCKLFSPAEIAAYIGEPVKAPVNAAMGTGCQWLAKDDEGDVIVQVVPAGYHTAPSMAEGYREVTDAGAKGFVVPQLGGWAAGAIRGESAVEVSVAGKAASDATAVALLKEAMKRQGG